MLQEICQLEGFLLVKVAGDNAAARFDGRADNRGRIKLAIEHDGQTAADIFAGDLAEALGAFRVEGEADFRLAEAAADDDGAFDTAAGHFRPLPDLDRLGNFAAIALP